MKPRTRHAFIHVGPAIVLALASFASTANESPAAMPTMEAALAAAVQQEIDGLRQRVESASIDDERWGPFSEQTLARLTEIEREIERGRAVLALHRLATMHNTVVAYLYSKEPAPEGADASLASVHATVQAGILSRKSPDGTGLAVARALTQAARQRIRPYASASLPYAQATGAESGLFYLGRARAFGDLESTMAALDLGPLPPPPTVRSLAPELDRLEREALAAYVPPLSIDRHSDFIAFNATLKLARELDEAGAWFGALDQYLDATLRLGTMRETERPVDAATLEARARQLSTRLDRSDRDESLGRLYLQQAQSLLESPAPGENPQDPTRVAVLLDQVMPAYFAALEPVDAGRPATDARVTVTLVRWPYT